MGVLRATARSTRSLIAAARSWRVAFKMLPRPRCGPRNHGLEAVVGKGLVGLCHLVHFLALLHRTAPALGRFGKLACEALPHRFLAALARRFPQPAHGERAPPYLPDFDRHLVVR